MIGRIAVRLQQHEVIQGTIVEYDLALDQVAERGLTVERALESNHRDYTPCLKFSSFFLAQVTAAAVIAAHRFLVLGHFHAHLGQPLLRTIAGIGVSLFHELSGYSLVMLKPLGLEIGPIVTSDLWTFVPVYPQPL